MLKLKLKNHEDDIKFEDLKTGTFFMWYLKEHGERTESELGMKISDLDKEYSGVLTFHDTPDFGVFYDWDETFHIERIVENMEWKEG